MGTWRRAALVPGIYDEVVSGRVAAEIARLPDALEARREQLSGSLAPLGALLAEAFELALAELGGDVERSVLAAQAVLHALREHAPRTFQRADELALRTERLLSIGARTAAAPDRPKGSLHASGLLVNAESDTLLEHVRSEVDSTDRIDLLCAFVKLSGYERMRRELERHCSERGRPLRVLTTTYMGASDAKAIERLAALPGAEVKVSYDEASTRLHAKAWIFHRASGVSTAYVGSSNLSHAAQTDGLEWNVRVTESEQPALLAQMAETFEQYWADSYSFERFDHRDEAARSRLIRALSPSSRRPRAAADDVLFHLDPLPHQRPILDELDAARALGRHTNLVVAATGTGKTVVAALDYRALRDSGRGDTLLYVAHRREILEQARRVFRSALGLRDFGELLFEGEQPAIGRHLFASIDSLLISDRPLDAFDVVILDEAHHAAADKWERLFERLRPRELIGLTGTPERTDGRGYEDHFPRPWLGNLRVWNAIPQALVPFRYYQLDVDGVDLRDVSWTAGRYAPEELAGRLVGAAEIFVARAIAALGEYVARTDDLRAIAFCANVAHAAEVERRFRARGYRVQLLTGDTPTHERRQARADLDEGRVQIICAVDIYNEGVDVPNVNTLFFFRPTESATVFLQQLGRGLRRTHGKAELVVFDLTGRQHHSFRFDRRLRAMLGHTPRELRQLVDTGMGRLPAGCLLHFDERSREDVLAQLHRSIPDDLSGLRALLREPAHATLSLGAFLHETDVELSDIYRKDRSWTALRRSIGLDTRPLAAGEEEALESVHKLLHVGDERRLALWEKLLAGGTPADEAEHRLAHMLFALLYGKEHAAGGSAASAWARHAIVREEIAQLIPVLRIRNALLSPPHVLAPEVPLVLHARYLGVELSAAFDHRASSGAFRDYYTGVEPVSEYDLLLVTLDKSAAAKEHLKYRDFPLNAEHFHWQSKARTTRDSRQGVRHLQPASAGCTPLLFVREKADDRPGVTMAFRYLGPVSPVSSEGERPITIEWRLAHPMPPDLVLHGKIA